MFGILISNETLPKILQDPKLLPEDIDWLKTCTNKERFFVTGNVRTAAAPSTWTVFPKHHLKRFFEYDDTKIQTDWDQIVRL